MGLAEEDGGEDLRASVKVTIELLLLSYCA
jgi:hypothetical protein